MSKKKIIKALYMDWNVKFQCIGGKCPLTCCSAEWDIFLTEEEIERFKNMDHPFRDEIMKCVDKEKKCMITDTKEGKCSLLTEDGWCRMVLACGEEYLSKTCTVFPRHTKQYGDIIEMGVEIVCPVVAGYLLENVPIEFGIQEQKTDEEIKEIDYQIYDSLALARGELMEVLQSLPEHSTGKLFIVFSVLTKIKELFQKNQLNKENVISIISAYTAEKNRNEILAQCEAIAGQYTQKAVILQSLLLSFQTMIIKNLDGAFSLDDTLRENIVLWITDKGEFSRQLESFAGYLEQEYPMVSENFWSYALFMDWIELEPEKFGQKIYARMFELALIQIFAMSAWVSDGMLDKEKYSVLISTVDRIFSHKKDFMSDLSEDLHKLERDNIANILMFLI